MFGLGKPWSMWMSVINNYACSAQWQFVFKVPVTSGNVSQQSSVVASGCVSLVEMIIKTVFKLYIILILSLLLKAHLCVKQNVTSDSIVHASSVLRLFHFCVSVLTIHILCKDHPHFRFYLIQKHFSSSTETQTAHHSILANQRKVNS